ncbi:MAG: hypothetical protein C5B54_11600 [Acidobacteria bacterium]|nr:MAG: hypothetical protein C5B54_11600 [Acidobacteriota bacterium]
MNRHFVPYLVILAAVALFLWRFVFLGQIPLDPTPLYDMRPWSTLAQATQIAHPDDPAKYYHNIDPVTQVFPLKEWFSKQAHQGNIPLWIPDIFSGSFFGINHHDAPWDWSAILFWLFPTPQAFAWTIFLQLLIAGSTMFFYCRTLSLSILSSLFGAFCFLFNGFLMHWISLIGFNAGLIWMPLIPAGIELAIREKSWKYSAITALGFGLQFLSGMAQFWFFNTFLLITYAAFRLIPVRNTGLSTAALVLIVPLLLGVGIGSVQIFTTASSVSQTLRGGDSQPRIYAGRNHLSPRRLPTLIVPDLYGSIQENVFSKLFLKASDSRATGFWGHLIWGEKGRVLNRTWGYIGIAGFVFMLGGMFISRGFFRYHSALTATVILFLSLLNLRLLHHLLVSLVPAFDSLDQTRCITLYTFSASILAANGMEHLGIYLSKLRKILPAATLLLLLAILLCWIFPHVVSVQDGVLSQSGTQTGFSKAFYQDAAQTIANSFGNSAAILYVPLLFLGVLSILFLSNRDPQMIKVAVIIVALSDLLYHGWNNPPLIFAEKTILDPPSTQVINFLKKDPDFFRVYELHLKRTAAVEPPEKYGDLEQWRTRWSRFFDPLSIELVARPNTLLHFGIQSAGGSMSLYPTRYSQLWSGRGIDILKAIEPHKPVDEWNQPWVGMQGVKYLLIPEEADTANWKPVFSAERIKVMKVDSFCSPIRIVNSYRVITNSKDLLAEIHSRQFDPGREVLLEKQPNIQPEEGNEPHPQIKMISRTANTMRIQVQTNQAGLLVISENYASGWQATIDHSSAEILRANYSFMALAVEKGNHEIAFEYGPPFYKPTLVLTAISLLIATLILFLAPRKVQKYTAAAVR